MSYREECDTCAWWHTENGIGQDRYGEWLIGAKMSSMVSAIKMAMKQGMTSTAIYGNCIPVSLDAMAGSKAKAKITTRSEMGCVWLSARY